MRKKITAMLLCVLCTAGFSACDTNNSTAATTAETTVQTTEATTKATVDESALTWGEAKNFTPPEAGEKIIVMKIKDRGEIKIKLFPEELPKACENFMGLTEMGYYDELIFHRIIHNFMNQGGDPQGTGYGGQSMWGGYFDGGLSHNLYHFSGAVCYANSGSTSADGSQFYIVNTEPGFMYTQKDIADYDYPQSVKDKYAEVGGTPFLDGGYTVFGQVIEGMDIVRDMGSVETDSNDKPLTQVLIESVRIEEYQP